MASKSSRQTASGGISSGETDMPATCATCDHLVNDLAVASGGAISSPNTHQHSYGDSHASDGVDGTGTDAQRITGACAERRQWGLHDAARGRHVGLGALCPHA